MEDKRKTPSKYIIYTACVAIIKSQDAFLIERLMNEIITEILEDNCDRLSRNARGTKILLFSDGFSLSARAEYTRGHVAGTMCDSVICYIKFSSGAGLNLRVESTTINGWTLSAFYRDAKNSIKRVVSRYIERKRQKCQTTITTPAIQASPRLS